MFDKKKQLKQDKKILILLLINAYSYLVGKQKKRYIVSRHLKFIEKKINDVVKNTNLLSPPIKKIETIDNLFKQTNKLLYKKLTEIESKQKEEERNYVIGEDSIVIDEDKNQTQYNLQKKYKIFAICSSHSDCAKDHLDYQGKLYYNKTWKTYITNRQLRNEVEQYISSNGLQTIEYITLRPVWLTTRPNCRHILTKLSISDVFTNNYKIEDTQHTEGNINHKLSSKGYTKNNINTLINSYQDRLKMHRGMLKVTPNSDDLKRSIEKDKFMIDKWKKVLRKV